MNEKEEIIICPECACEEIHVALINQEGCLYCPVCGYGRCE